MTGQIQAILWAQFRVFRNVLPRTDLGTIAVWLVSLLWYGAYAAIAGGLAIFVPHLPLHELDRLLPVTLLLMLLFWQLFPLMTLSGGWSIELAKLLVYPIQQKTLFAVEVLLRVTTAPEMLIVLSGLTVGLLRHSALWWPRVVMLLLFVPLNLFLSLAIRGLAGRVLSRNRLKTLLLILFLTLSVLPSLALNTSLGATLKIFLLASSRVPGTPWREFSLLALGASPLLPFCLVSFSIALAYWWARNEFGRMVRSDQGTFAGSVAYVGKRSAERRLSGALLRIPSLFFKDPLAALIEKELLVLFRSPRFRLIFGIACLFSVVVFFPLAFGTASSAWATENYLPAINIYGLLIVGETLLWNTFGFDRRAAQIYFVAPIRFAAVLHAKNIVAAVMIALMTLLITLVGSFFRGAYGIEDFGSSVLLTSVVTIYFLAFGNFTSVRMPRPIDPNQTMKNQNNAKASVLLLGAALLLVIPIGLAFSARWAFESQRAFLVVLAADFLGGLAIYQVTTENAIERAGRDREKILSLLAAGSNPIAD